MANNGMRNIWNDRKREEERLERLRRKKQPVHAEDSVESGAQDSAESNTGLIAQKTAAESGPSDADSES